MRTKRLREWWCKKFGHTLNPIEEVFVNIGIREIEQRGKTNITISCTCCKHKFSVQKMYELTHDGTNKSYEEITKLSEVTNG